eukprot:TRINITY_DN16075_c0_g1_i1.p1 TRINITY_DN16075_c0_g1~~TRINITY_DN16075_c0_g1_i1.p1  ORF type:complete len:828 (-),score=195.32 TRINITY_DN16075_c0_g1_i1:134-2617(-)
MAARGRGPPAARGQFHSGAKVEYYSKSYDEWIPAVVGSVRADGNLQLLHDDGSVLKEQADASLVRLAGSGDAPGAKAPAAGGRAMPPRSPSLGRVPGAKAAAVPAAKAGAGAGLRSNTPQRASTPVSGRAPSPALRGAGMGVVGGANGGAVVRAPSAPSRAAAAHAAVGKADAERTTNSKSFYPGDRAKIKESGRQGLILYVGTPSYSSKEIVGMQLDEKRSKAECDGKAPNNERLFRCPLGFGIFLPAEDVELLPPAGPDSFAAVQAPASNIDVKEALSELIGLAGVKQQIMKVKQVVEVQKKREALGVCGGRPLHFAFRGNRGTGMSQTAKTLAHLLRDLEVVASGQLIETSRKELLSGSGDAEKQMNQVWKAAAGGVLMLNDAHTLQDRERSRDSDGLEASEFLAKQLSAMEAKCAGESAQPCFPQASCVILALPQDAVLPDSLQRAKVQVVDFPDYSHDELVSILIQIVQKRKFSLAPSLTPAKLLPHVREASNRTSDANQKNITMLQHLLEEAIARQTERAYSRDTISLHGLTTLIEDDFVDSMSASRDEKIRTALAKLENVIGLPGVKAFIKSLYAQLKTEAERRDAGVAVSGSAGTLHMIFSGNPGTGKTTVARIVADLLCAMGLLRKGHMVEADRAALVAGYSGQTALKTRQIVESAMGGVLFVDEAYALVSEDGKDSFGKEALDTLIKLIEDRRGDLVVILAGYPDEMARLVSTNPGVKSRFPTQVLFEDYTEAELMSIAIQMLGADGFSLSSSAKKVLTSVLSQVASCTGREQGNGRAVRNILEQARRKMAVRLQAGANGGARSKEELCTLEAADLQ